MLDDAVHHVGGQHAADIAEDVAVLVDHERRGERPDAVAAEHLARRIHEHGIRDALLVDERLHVRFGHVAVVGTAVGFRIRHAQHHEVALVLNVRPEAALKELVPGTFDVITLWHVMEHLEHLDETWELLRELLTEKGVLIVAVPNCSSYDAMKYGKYWAAYDVPRHLWHFTPATIQQFGSKHGFILAARHPMPFDAFYVSMLTEKHKGSAYSFVKGMWTGTAAWLSAQAKKERSSSMIYVFRKKR